MVTVLPPRPLFSLLTSKRSPFPKHSDSETLILGESETELFQKYAEFMDGNTRKINRIFNGYMIARSIAFELNVFQDFNNMYKLILLCTIFTILNQSPGPKPARSRAVAAGEGRQLMR